MIASTIVTLATVLIVAYYSNAFLLPTNQVSNDLPRNVMVYFHWDLLLFSRFYHKE